ncbi:dithiol-disulfide isomerase [Paenibacillus oryzae]|uniref:Dithiol-disulfide isomerase n=1 Tax=Paenibacillus oryzae TaxID=1844972 RepID=A0A1A5YDV9_9BACL|nr:DsbA family protein [Paenibacillus oryzae]OBR63773.1 dithiol-disulfide isomerase [Paenibacillus oryzae]
MSDSNHNMMCDLETGMCGPADEEQVQAIDLNQLAKKFTLYYVTDPICSHCWALEPVLNRFLRQYGHYFNLKVVMGGLLPSWHGFADNSNGIQKPADVAHHWKEVGLHSRMPIDGSLWISDPILSSYPPSRVFKVIALRHPGKEIEFLRRAREAVFVFNQNIGEDSVLEAIVNGIGLDGARIIEEAGQESAQALLDGDFELAASLGVRGFPTLVLVNEENKGVKISGARPLEAYISALQQLSAAALEPRPVPALSQLIQEEPLLFAREIEEMYDIESHQVEAFAENELAQDTYSLQTILDELVLAAKK